MPSQLFDARYKGVASINKLLSKYQNCNSKSWFLELKMGLQINSSK
ncbi:hypothetical protein EV14_2264 [Prochlorococcus sp. MIT 0703]|nr:hypothetical protein EV14_2264 [Prochlorococcus sp. MIT 0703]